MHDVHATVGWDNAQLELPFILYSSMVLAGAFNSTGFFMLDTRKAEMSLEQPVTMRGAIN